MLRESSCVRGRILEHERQHLRLMAQQWSRTAGEVRRAVRRLACRETAPAADGDAAWRSLKTRIRETLEDIWRQAGRRSRSLHETLDSRAAMTDLDADILRRCGSGEWPYRLRVALRPLPW